MASPWILSPSDFAFLWDECPRCFYQKIVRRDPRPRGPFPKIFTLIDGAMKGRYIGQRSEQLTDGLPPGWIDRPKHWMRSVPWTPPGALCQLVIRGMPDLLVCCVDRTAVVVDLKTTEPVMAHLVRYARQLHAYAWCLERPERGPAVQVSGLGLLCFSPDAYERHGARGALLGALRWVPIERDEEGFEQFLGELAAVLDGPEPPEPSPTCAWCAWRVTDVSLAA